jgi:hypothetical protein
MGKKQTRTLCGPPSRRFRAHHISLLASCPRVLLGLLHARNRTPHALHFVALVLFRVCGCWPPSGCPIRSSCALCRLLPTCSLMLTKKDRCPRARQSTAALPHAPPHTHIRTGLLFFYKQAGERRHVHWLGAAPQGPLTQAGPSVFFLAMTPPASVERGRHVRASGTCLCLCLVTLEVAAVVAPQACPWCLCHDALLLWSSVVPPPHMHT